FSVLFFILIFLSTHEHQNVTFTSHLLLLRRTQLHIQHFVFHQSQPFGLFTPRSNSNHQRLLRHLHRWRSQRHSFMQRRSQTKSRLHQLHNKRSQTALRKLRTILGEMEPVPLYHILSNVSVMDKEGFSKGLGELLDSLGSKIVDAYETSARVKGTVYALAQCIPDLSKSDCRICLSQIFAGVPTCCDGKSEEKQPLSPPKNDTKIITCPASEFQSADEIESTYSLHFDFDTIRVATDDFSLTTKIGEGGFGAVYKRHCLVLIIGISRGLLYLHQVTEFSIIHRVLKSSNVHLDEQMHPKISDFGMARQFDFYKTQATTKRVAWKNWLKEQQWT
ncbi:hypothetical protein HID58_001140, partial [Brassica napus]